MAVVTVFHNPKTGQLKVTVGLDFAERATFLQGEAVMVQTPINPQMTLDLTLTTTDEVQPRFGIVPEDLDRKPSV